MSDHHPRASNTVNSTLVSFIFIVTFIICVLILAKMQEVSHPQTVEAAAEVAQVEMTSTPASTTAPTAIPTSLPPTAEVAIAPTTAPASSNAAAPQTAAYDPALVARGQELFMTCSACHGPDAHGLPNLGKDLIASEFVGGLTDDEFVQFITTGRPLWDPLNTTGIDMPPKGGNPAISTEDLQAIVAYIRTLRAQSGAAAAPAPQTAAYDPALVAQGQEGFMLCSACHGPDARGLPNLGKDLVTSEFARGLTDQELLEFVKKGRPMWDPLNTTGIDMPPKGGNPALADDQILAIIAYIRTLEAANKG
jgi:disulfide bond formation protein DsbB